MSKHALVVLCGLIALFALARNGTAQQAQPQAAGQSETPTGTFLTAEDLEHLDAALGYINLTRESLNYEKKHVDHKLRLKVGDLALDQPLSVPSIAEAAADQFTASATATARARHAGKLLDLPQERWSPEELLKDGLRENEPREFFHPVDDRDRYIRAVLQLFFGGPVEFLQGPPAPEPTQGPSALGTILRCMTTQGTMLRVPPRFEEGDVAALAGGIGGMVAAGELPLPGAEASTVKIYDAGSRVDLAALLVAGGRLSDALTNMAAQWLPHIAAGLAPDTGGEPSKIPGITGTILHCWQGPLGKFVIGGTGPNTYEGDDFIGIIDLGGDDIYRGRVASGIGLPGKSPIGFVLDLGGNDRYEGGDFTQGFGFMGVGVLHDLGAGNDFYSARFCAQACGLCGYGELFDDGGDDIFIADSGAQGCAIFGYGHLINAAGNDIYRGARYVQAFAQVKGVGVLTDGGGNDLYYAGGKYLHQPLWNDRYQSLSQGFAIGNRNDGTGGGVALLLDEGDGNDVYQADIYGQGSSYWYSLGMLVDRGGNDTYTVGQYGQGAGIHLSAGILVDLAGNDTYAMALGVGVGGAHDWAVGWLIDRAGNDLYSGNGQGQGLNYAIGILLDCAGDDSRSTNNDGSIGKGHNNDISLVLDLAGNDFYGVPGVKDGQFTRRGEHALIYDVPDGWFPGVDPSTLPTVQNPAPLKTRVQHILISWKGAHPGVTLKDPDRTREQADALMRKVMREARRKGGDWKQLQLDHNEDTAPHNTYDAQPNGNLVKPFQDLALRLGTGQIDVCESQFGWHIIKRVE